MIISPSNLHFANAHVLSCVECYFQQLNNDAKLVVFVWDYGDENLKTKTKNMREIKFRAFDKDSNRMHYFNYDSPCLEGDWYITFNGRVFERHGGTGGDFEVENIILMQSTGLKDNSGNEIYEGDIVKQKEWIAQIKWQPQNAMFYMKSDNHYWEFYKCCISDNGEMIMIHDVEVIGNIYQNASFLTERNVRVATNTTDSNVEQ